MRKLRITSQVTFFALFAATFFWVTTRPHAYELPSQWFLWLNPLPHLLISAASRDIVIPGLVLALVVLVLTLVFGRFFCGFVCPLGAMVDFSDKHLFGKMRSVKRQPPRYLQRLKYVTLTGLLVLSVVGVLFPLFMDPLSLTTRLFTIVAYPVIHILGVQTLHAATPALRTIGLGELTLTSIKVPLFYGTFGALLLLAAVLAGGFWDRRFWCQYVCPSGAFFGLLSRWAPFRRVVSTYKCNECKRCTRVCPTRAIDRERVQTTSTAECIVCGNCVAIREGCSAFRFATPASDIVPPDMRRRHVLAGVVGGVVALPALEASAMGKRDHSGRLIRPPGAIPENDFMARCIACGQCMKACPTTAIQPCTFHDGFHRLYTPKIVPRIGGCEEKCYLCGHVCPTGAIRSLSYEQKRFAKIGTAVIDRHRCLAWEQNKECLVCDEVCPYNAVEFRLVETTTALFRVPVVHEDLCIGCGLCEQHCPINDKAAIVVFRFGENRREEGAYVSQWRREDILEKRRRSDSRHFGAAGGGMRKETAGIEPQPQTIDTTQIPQPDPQGDLPPGFVE